jgi:phosphoribosylaminoimidazole-succinocarboxamide synthase
VGTVNPNTIEVKAVNVLRPNWIEGQYDYSMYQDGPTHALVPLEVIFRKHLGQGNSLEGRLKKNPAYLADLGLKEIPSGATTFDPALVEFSTKLETSDRYLTKKEIADMNIVSEAEQKALRTQTQEIVVELEKLFASFGVKLWDGKVEYAFGNKKADGNRELLLVDSIGPDELRLTYEGLPLSKEFLRQLYGDTSWSNAVKKAKDLAAERKTQDWKTICKDELKETPKKLTPQQIEVSALLYQALANEVAGFVGRKKPFAENMTLKLWHEKAQSILGK